MSTTTPAPNTTGKGLLEGLIAWRAKDDSADNFVASLYAHVNIEFSATEATEWLSFFEFISQLIKVGGGAVAGINKTGGSLSIEPVAVSGYDLASGLPTLIAADPALNIPAMAHLLAALANNASGVAYVGGVTGPVTSGFDQTGTTVGTKLYLKVGGGLTFTPDFTQPFYQVVGYTTDQLNPGNFLPFVEPPLISASNVSATGILYFPEVDLKALATTTMAMPVGTKLNIDEVGLRLTILGGSMVTQPTIEFGITGNNSKYWGPTITTLLTATGKRERFTTLGPADDAETSLTFTVTVVAAGSGTIKGKPYFRGIPQ